MPLVVTTLANGETADSLVTKLLSPNAGLTVTGGTPLVQGNTRAAGSYVGARRTTVPPDAGNVIIAQPANGHGFLTDTGVVLATGQLRKAVQPMATFLAGGDGDGSNFYEYSDDLGVSNQAFALPIATINGVANTRVHDPISLKFDFVPQGTSLQFQFWFTSYEYEEFIGTAFTDTFLALLNGVNIALIPGTAIFISINNVNHVDTPTWFARGTGVNTGNMWREIGGNGLVCDRRSGASAGEDGLGNWLPITIVTPVTPGASYTLEFLLADVQDGFFESAVFLAAGSLGTGFGCQETLPNGTDSGGVAGCNSTLGSGTDTGGGAGCVVSL